MNNRGFQLSINMLVVLILGLAMLGIGISLFYNAYDKTQDLKSDVDSQTQVRLNALLDDGSIVVIPQKNIDGKRGDLVQFSLGVTNIHPDREKFVVYVTYGGSSAFLDEPDTFNPFDYYATGDFNKFSVCPDGDSSDVCGTSWVVIPRGDSNKNYRLEFFLDSNERYYTPIGIQVPKSGDVVGGQYIFNVDVCIGDDCISKPLNCHNGCVIDDDSRYDSRQKVIVNI